MKGRLRDLKNELKKSENRSYDNLGTDQRLNLGSSRRIIEEDDNHVDTSEHGNEEQSQDSDPLFPPYPPANPDSPSRREESTPKQKVTFSYVCFICEVSLRLTLFTITCIC